MFKPDRILNRYFYTVCIKNRFVNIYDRAPVQIVVAYRSYVTFGNNFLTSKPLLWAA